MRWIVELYHKKILPHSLFIISFASMPSKNWAPINSSKNYVLSEIVVVWKA
jgi:hypothetical protein